MPALFVARATRLIPASAPDIFELLASPAAHALIDGSGTVLGAQPRTPARLGPGAKFGMQMKIGASYKILNEVVEFEEGRRIAWRHFGGHVWRYLLDPVNDSATQVTEEFDPRQSRASWVIMLLNWSARNQRSIEQTLVRLEEWALART